MTKSLYYYLIAKWIKKGYKIFSKLQRKEKYAGEKNIPTLASNRQYYQVLLWEHQQFFFAEYVTTPHLKPKSNDTDQRTKSDATDLLKTVQI